MGYRRNLVIGLFVAGAALGAALLFSSRSSPRVSGPIQHDAYVWQRHWTPAVESAIRGRSPVSSLIVLAAEVSWRSGNASVVRVDIDLKLLREHDHSAAIALRIGNRPGGLGAGEIETLSQIAASLVTDFSAAELQIDYDCPESKLGEYRRLLTGIRERVKPTRVTFTALPSWLGRPGFEEIARDAGEYVLQVHSFERPRDPQSAVICDPVKAKRAVEEAGRLGVPFRVALPTYGYLLAFHPDGTFLGLSAEGPARDWPQDVTVRPVLADAAAMSSLVNEWTHDRPAALRGIIWYRLPTADDTLNWRMKTLRAVIEGETLAPRLTAGISKSGAGLFDVFLTNEGNVDAGLSNVSVVLSWSEGTYVAADGLNAFSAAPPISIDPARQTLTLQRRAEARNDTSLRAGDRLPIGWIRLSHDTEVGAHVQTNQSRQ